MIVCDANLVATASASIDSGIVHFLARFVVASKFLWSFSDKKFMYMYQAMLLTSFGPEAPGTLDLLLNRLSA
jgi:hypothetical protein